jgi:UDP-N-acetyl-D-glucosamine dehydrogenase
MRESPTFALMDLLKKRGASSEFYDPYIPIIKPTREHGNWTGKKSVKWNRKIISSFDLVLISTAHDAVNYNQLAKWNSCIVDTRNVMAKIKTKDGQVWRA